MVEEKFNARFGEIRRALRETLTQGYDVFYPTIPSALLGVVANSETLVFLGELEELAACSDEEVTSVLEDHDVYLWEDISPRELLVTLTTLCKLSG